MLSGSYRIVKVIFLAIWLLFQVLALGTLIVIPIDVLGREGRLCYKTGANDGDDTIPDQLDGRAIQSVGRLVLLGIISSF